MKNSILYFFDPICGWCFGFSTHFYKFWEKYQDQYNFRVVTGGMVRGGNVGPIEEKAAYLKDAYPRVEEMTGVKFGQPFLEVLDDGQTVFGSDIASLVFHALSKNDPSQQVVIAKAIQSAIYVDGADPMDLKQFEPIAEQFDINPTELAELVESKEVRDAYENDLYTTQQFGISGFPFVLVSLDGEYYQVSKGFRPYEELDAILDKAIEYHGERQPG